MTITYFCTNCGSNINLPVNGEHIRCPQCDGELKIASAICHENTEKLREAMEKLDRQNHEFLAYLDHRRRNSAILNHLLSTKWHQPNLLEWERWREGKRN